MFAIQKGIVQAVNAARHEVQGTLSVGAEFRAYYYGNTPVVGDIVFVTPVADGSWIVVTGPTSAQGLFGIGGDQDVTITANTAADSASRTTSADGTFATGGVTPENAYTVTSASAAFTSADVGSIISGTGIPSGTVITTIGSSTSVTISQAVSAPGASVTLTIYERAPAKWTKSGSAFTLIRDLYCVNLTLDPTDGAFSLITNGYRIFCLGTFLIGAGITVHNNGLDASGTTGGSNARANVLGRAVGAGANAIAGGAPGDGTAATAVTTSMATISTVAIQSGGQGGFASNLVSGFVEYDGGTGGTVINAITNGWPAYVPKLLTGDILAGTTLFAGGAGGGSGAVDGGTIGTGRAGAGGGGGGVLGIYARQLVNLGTISADGGAGSAATLGTATDASFGGGGGGGGGAVILVFGATGSTVGQVTATGGAAGGGFAGAGGLGVAADDPDFYSLSSLVVIRNESAGGTGGAAATVGATYSAVAGTDGQPGLIWALPL